MAANSVNQQQLRSGVVELTMADQERGTDPLTWAARLSSTLAAAVISMPSVEVAEILVSHICWSNNIPIAWKFLEKALSLRIVPPLFVLALLSNRVLSSRRRYPVAYRLYMELIKRYAFSLPSLINGSDYNKTMESIGDVLRFRQLFGVQPSEPGHLVVEFVFSVVWELLDASLEDDGLLEHTLEKKSRWPIESGYTENGCLDRFEGKKMERQAALSKMNTLMAIELIGDFFQDKVTSWVLYLVRRNMSMHWECFNQHLRLLIANSSSLRNSKNISPEGLLQLSSDTHRYLTHASKMSIIATKPMPSAGKCNGTVPSGLWLPIDLYLEDTVNGNEVSATSVAETLTGLVKALKALNQTTWQDAFLGLWTGALRLVQRERNPIICPHRCLDTCLCMVLCIPILAVVNIVGEEEIMLSGEAEQRSTSQRKCTEFAEKCREDLVSSLQRLGDFEELLTPPPLVSSLANQAAMKAMMFLSGLTLDSGHLIDMPVNCSGNLRHLIVESCIARNVLDTSAYLWPGYVRGHCNQIPRNISGQMPGWSSFMKGSPLTPPMINALVLTPATSLAEIERVNTIAVNGTEDEKISAVTILCGASLCRGWNIQEHTALMITKLLSPASHTEFSGSDSHLIGYAPFLNALLVGISLLDCIQIFSLHGLVPQLAAALMPICEVFGSCAPNKSWTLNTGEEISSHSVFSNALVLLLKLWRFDQPPMEHVMGDGIPMGSHLTPEYLLLVHNSQIASSENVHKSLFKTNMSRLSYQSLRGPVYMESFPKLNRWYRKDKECISSVLSSLVPGTTVHEIAEALLSMMFRKLNRGQLLTPTNSDETCIRLKFPAWDILEAVPFVFDAALSACAHGRLSPRELTTGLKDLADFLPASLATILSYSATEVTRGLCKHALLNGIDWPSPAANLCMVEEQIKEILAATGVSFPCLDKGASSTVTIPLPLAALISLTLTFKVTRGDKPYLDLVGPTLRDLAIGCPWPCMSAIASLWSQKAKPWTEFLVLSAAQTVFYHNNDAIVQLLRVCFTTALGINSSATSNGGVGALLGHGFGSHLPGGISAVAPGMLYLKVHRSVRNVTLLTEEIVSLLMNTVKDISNGGLPRENVQKLKKTKYSMKYGQISLAAAIIQVKNAASLGASLVWITGRLNSIHSLVKEILPSWFISSHESDPNRVEQSGTMYSMLGGYALAYFIVFCGLFAWGEDASSPASKRRPKVLGRHFEFLASALEGRISLGCNKATWRAYVTGYLSLMICCTPGWMLEIDVEVVKRVSKGLKQWNEEEMAMALLGISGIGAMGVAAEMIMETT